MGKREYKVLSSAVIASSQVPPSSAKWQVEVAKLKLDEALKLGFATKKEARSLQSSLMGSFSRFQSVDGIKIRSRVSEDRMSVTLYIWKEEVT